MDPHSTLSQFNQRHPKAGPMARSQDSVAIPKRAAKRPKLQSFNSSPVLTERPIATNSRIKQDEKYRRDMYLIFVNDALQKKTMGVTEPFDELVSQFNIKHKSDDPSLPPYQPAQLRLWFSALSYVVSRLERTHAALVQAIINMPWTTLGPATVKSYTIFLGNLLSSRPEYLSLVLRKIAQGFTHQSGLQALDNVGAETSSSPLTRRIIYDRLHDLLQHLLSLFPTLPTTLQPLLVRNFPHKRQNQIAQVTYIRNLLRISGYCPEVADKILSTIIDRAIQIDAKLEELEEQEEKAQHDDIFELDPFDTVIGQEGESSSDSEREADGDELDFSDISSGADDDETEIPTNMKHIQEMVTKLDVILNLIFEYFSQTYASTKATSNSPPSPSSKLPSLSPLELPPPSSSVDCSFLTPESTPTSTAPLLADVLSKRAPDLAPSERLRAQFNTLLSIFDRTILRTFKSRYTQFLVFWFTSLDTEFADIFQGMLIDRALFARHTPTVTRAAAASYIGSFVSRAAFVDRTMTRQVVGVLCQFLRAHIDAVDEVIRMYGPGLTANINEGVSSIIGKEQNTVFYAVVQAVFLIFCFRWRDLLEDADDQEEDEKWMTELSVLQRVVTSVLNPLKLCSPSVVAQFARVAHSTDFLYCYSIIQSNKHSDHSSKSSSDSPRPASTIAPSVTELPLPQRESIVLELNTFFPFDPYRLQCSGSYIQGIYREWSSVAIEEDEEEEEEDEDNSHAVTDSDAENESTEVNVNGPSRSIPISGKATGGEHAADGLKASLEAMSISPAHPVRAR
ncbi:RNA polymerase I-specific transcription initiation factor RRN3 [Amanita muscaria]